MRSTITIYAFTASVLLSGHALAQAPAGPPIRLAGTVQSVSEGKITVVSDKGETTEAAVPADAVLTRGVDASRAELAAAKIVNCAATGASGDLLQAAQCGIIPPDTKLVNRGHFPSASGPSRTTGDITSVKGDPSKDLELVIAYKEGQQRVAVPLSAKVTKSAPVELRQVKPGDTVVAATRVTDGKTSVLSMAVTQK